MEEITLNDVIVWIDDIAHEARESERSDREALGASYDANSYGAGYTMGILEACRDLRSRLYEDDEP